MANLSVSGKWAESNGRSSLLEYGKILTFDYLGVDTTDPEQVRVYKVKYAKKGIKAMSFTLQRGGHFGTFRFDTSSDEIDRMLKSAK